MRVLSYDEWCWAGRISRDHNPFKYGAIDDLDIHDAAYAASLADNKAASIDVFIRVLEQKLEMPPMFDGMTI